MRGVLAEAEVGQVDVVLIRDQDVRRLHVTVDQVARVRGVERARDLRDEVLARAGSSGPPLVDHGAQVRPVDPAHADEQDAVLLAGLVDRDHVGVVDRGRDPRLALEALAARLGPGPSSSATSFSATVRPSRRWVARKITPIPPRPASASIR